MCKSPTNIFYKNAIATGLVLIASGVSAQGNPGGLEEIIVTAQKRAQSVQDVPIAITALSGEGLANKGIENILDLGQVTPSFNVTRIGGASVFFLRGVGSNNFTPGNEAPVATFIDGVYLPNANANTFSFNNIERVEVLKGPQGTLFGRNATGGVVHVVTKDPTHEPAVRARVGYGNYDTFEGNFYGSTGLTENAAIDLAVYYRDQQNSPFDNPVPGVNHTPDSTISVRSKLLLTPNDKTSVKLAVFYEDFKSSVGVIRHQLPGAVAAGGGAHSGDWYDIPNDFASHQEVTSKGVSGEVNYSFENMDITSITSYMESDPFFSFDNDGSGNFIQDSDQHIVAETFTQELRLTSTAESDLSWVLGFYYYDNLSAYDPGQEVFTPAFTLNSLSTQETKSWALFADTNYKLTEKTNLTLGLRYTEDDLKHYGQTRFNTTFFPEYNQNETFEEITYRVVLDHRISDSTLLYASHSRGYKSGVYNLLVTTPSPEGPVQPEILDAYEVGFKADGLFDNRVRINGAAFWYDYKNLQVQQSAGSFTVVTNAASSSLQGIELEAEAQLTDNFSLSLGLGYLDSEYDDYVGVKTIPNVDASGNPTGGAQGNVPADFSGNAIILAPEFTFNLGVNYTLPTDIGVFAVDANLYYNEGFYWTQDNRLKEPSYELLNVQAFWADPSETYKIGFWGKNLTDTEYSLYTSSSPSSSDAYVPALPRTYGAFIEYNFN